MKQFKKILKILGFIVVGVVFLLAIASAIVDPYVKDFLEKKINSAAQGEYSVEIDNVNISILRGNFIVEGVHLVTDTVAARENETPVINLDAKEISVEGVSWFNFLLSNNMQLDRLSLLDLVVEAKVRTVPEDTVDTGPFKWEDLDIYPMIKDQVSRLRLSDLRFGNIDLTLINVESADTLKFDADEFNLFSDDILIDADRVFTNGRAFFASEIDIQGKNVSIDRMGSLRWQVFLELIEFETRESDFSMLSENARFLENGDNTQDTVLFAFAQKFNFSELNLNKVQEDSVANINSIYLSHLTLVNNMDIDEEEAKKSAEKADQEIKAINISEVSFRDYLPELLDKIRIEEITLENIHYSQKDLINVAGITFVTRDMQIDKNPAFAENRFLHANTFMISFDSLSYLDKKQLLSIGLENFNFNIEDGIGNLGLDSLSVQHTRKIQGEIFVEAKLNSFNITGIDTRNLTAKSFAIDSISIEYPTMILDMPEVNSGGGSDENSGMETSPDLYPAIADFLNELQVRKIALIEADVQVSGLKGTSGPARIPAIYLQISDLLIAEGTAFSGNRIMHADDIAIRVENIDAPLAASMQVGMDLFRLSTREGLFELQGISYTPQRDPEQLILDPEIDMVLKVKNDHFKISNLNYAAIIQKQDFVAGAVSLNGLDVEVFGELAFAEEEAQKAAKEAEDEFEFDISEFSLGDMLPENFGTVQIGDIELQDIRLNHKDLIKVEGLEFYLDKMQIDKRPAFAENRFLHAESFRFSMDSVSYLEQNQMMRLAFRDFELDMKNGVGNFGLDNITAKHSEQLPGELYVDASIEGFLIKGINTKEITNKKFAIDSIAISYPEIFADINDGASTKQNGDTNAEKQASEAMDLYPAISDFLKEVQINKIALIEADISVDGLAENTARFPAVYIQVSDLLIAEGTAFQDGRVMHTKDIAARLEKIDFPLPDNVNQVGLELFEMSTREGLVQADGFVYDYNDNYKELMQGPETNMVFKITNDNFLIKGLDFGNLIQQKGVFADSILISESLNAEVFVDNHYQAAKSEELPATIQQLIKEIEMPHYLGALKVDNAHIVYKELAEDGDEPGRFWMEELNLTVINLTNVDQKINENPETTISLNTMLMGDGYLKTGLSIPMDDLSRPVNFSGRLDSLDLTQLNHYTEYTSLFGFESGEMYTLLWDFDAGNEEANGIFGLSYENLNIQLSKPESPAPAGSLLQVGSYLANVLILDEDKSEDKSDPPKMVDFDREKDEEESFVDHYIASIMAGFLEIMGFPLSIIDP